MKAKTVLVVSDNPPLIRKFRGVVERATLDDVSFTYRCSGGNAVDTLDELMTMGLLPINLKNQANEVANEYDLLISLHCKQMVPEVIIKRIRCINIHPGYNPYNRGWYPQVFSIINKKPFGITIHEMDIFLDHGPVIAQKRVPIHEWDTSLSVYLRAMDEEIALLEETLPALISGDYTAIPMQDEGNLNFKKDFRALCSIDLNHTGTFGEHIDLLRALSHGEFKNAFFLTSEGRKVFVRIVLDAESGAETGSPDPK